MAGCRERIVVDGAKIPEEAVLEGATRVFDAAAAEGVRPNFFEVHDSQFTQAARRQRSTSLVVIASARRHATAIATWCCAAVVVAPAQSYCV